MPTTDIDLPFTGHRFLRGWEIDKAWWQGYWDGLADDYDCRPFYTFSLFTAYESGRDAGIQARSAFNDDDGPFQPQQLTLEGV